MNEERVNQSERDNSVVELASWVVPDNVVMTTLPHLLAINSRIGQPLNLRNYQDLMRCRLLQMIRRELLLATMAELNHRLAIELTDLISYVRSEHKEPFPAIASDDQGNELTTWLLAQLEELLEPLFHGTTAIRLNVLESRLRAELDQMTITMWVRELVGMHRRRDNGLAGALDPLDEFL